MVFFFFCCNVAIFVVTSGFLESAQKWNYEITTKMIFINRTGVEVVEDSLKENHQIKLIYSQWWSFRFSDRHADGRSTSSFGIWCGRGEPYFKSNGPTILLWKKYNNIQIGRRSKLHYDLSIKLEQGGHTSLMSDDDINYWKSLFLKFVVLQWKKLKAEYECVCCSIPSARSLQFQAGRL